MSADRFSSLPEGCISDILSLTSPRDVCRSAATSRGFNLAAGSDTVWERFLPSDCRRILSTSLSPALFATNKQMFFGLAQSPVLIGRGNMSFGVDKDSGKICYTIGARLLTIIWGDTYSYWRWISLPESRFAEVAQLNWLCRVEIIGRINTQLLSKKTTYAAHLVFRIEQRNSGLDDFRLKASIRFVQEGPDQGDNEHSIVYFKRPSRHSREPELGRLPRNRSDGWKEIELGKFASDDGNNGEVEMRLSGSESYSWKSGLVIQGIELRPKADM